MRGEERELPWGPWLCSGKFSAFSKSEPPRPWLFPHHLSSSVCFVASAVSSSGVVTTSEFGMRAKLFPGSRAWNHLLIQHIPAHPALLFSGQEGATRNFGGAPKAFPAPTAFGVGHFLQNILTPPPAGPPAERGAHVLLPSPQKQEKRQRGHHVPRPTLTPGPEPCPGQEPCSGELAIKTTKRGLTREFLFH